MLKPQVVDFSGEVANNGHIGPGGGLLLFWAPTGLITIVLEPRYTLVDNSEVLDKYCMSRPIELYRIVTIK